MAPVGIDFRPESPVWRWVRFALLAAAGAMGCLALWGTARRGELLPDVTVWFVALLVVFAVNAWMRRPTITPLIFTALFVGMQMGVPTHDYGAEWFLAFAMCIDANSRKPARLGPGVLFALVVIELFRGQEAMEQFSIILYLVILTLLGQFIRLTFQSSRAQRAAAELRVALERSALNQAVHDTAGARLAQVLMMAAQLRRETTAQDALRSELDAIIEVASAGAVELREVINPTEAAAIASGQLGQEWNRSIRTLRTAGFDVADAPAVSIPTLPMVVEAEGIRVIREVTANICRHAREGGRVVGVIGVDSTSMTLSWFNDVDESRRPGDSSGLGLAGIREAVQQLGGECAVGASEGVFSIRVRIPIQSADMLSEGTAQ